MMDGYRVHLALGPVRPERLPDVDHCTTCAVDLHKTPHAHALVQTCLDCERSHAVRRP